LFSLLRFWAHTVEMTQGGAVAVFQQPNIHGFSVATRVAGGTRLAVTFTKLPAGPHGFHIHVAGDLRDSGCSGACAHWHAGPREAVHGGPPGSRGPRHTGDLGNIEIPDGSSEFHATYMLRGVSPSELWGRTLIVHEGPDDLGLGGHDDSKVTGHSGARIGCAIFGRMAGCDSKKRATRKREKRI
jgi:Cu/Zn superoxide dismutase